MLKFAGIIDNISESLGKIVSFLCYGLTAIISFEVVMRYIFNAPTIWVHEMSGFLLYTIVVLSIAYTHRNRGHVNVDMVVNKFPPKVQQIIAIAGWPFFLVLFGVLLWKSFEFGWLSVTRMEHTDTFWKPVVYPVKMLMPIGYFLMLLQGIANLIHDIYKLRGVPDSSSIVTPDLSEVSMQPLQTPGGEQ